MVRCLLLILLVLSACGWPQYRAADASKPSNEQGLILGRLQIEGWESLEYLNPLTHPMGSPFIFIELKGDDRSWFTHAEGKGHFLMPVNPGYLQVEKIILLSPYATYIEITLAKPFLLAIRPAQTNYIGSLHLQLTPESRILAKTLPQTYMTYRTEVQLKAVILRRDEELAALSWLQKRYPATWPVRPEAGLKSLRQEQILTPFLQ